MPFRNTAAERRAKAVIGVSKTAGVNGANMTARKRWIGLIVFLAVCLGAAALGALVTRPEIDGWYRTIAKPRWNPPDAVFGPVWTVLYILMAIAAWVVWQKDGLQRAATPLALFATQLLLNVAWSWIFFGWRQPGWAFVEILALWAAIAVTAKAFWNRSTVAGVLMMPYLAWVSFAVVLNLTIWRLNVV